MQGAISALSLNNIFYIVKKLTSTAKAYLAVETAASSFKVIEVTAVMVRKTLQERWPDFEDALQYHAALKFRSQVIISRDASGFSDSKIPVMDCHQYLALLKQP